MARFLHRRVVSHYGFVVVPLPQTLVEGWPIHRVDTPRIFQRCQRFICANHVSQSNPPILCRGNPCGCPGWYAPACHVGDGLGAHKGRPYQYNNSMNMVGHCDKRVHLDGWKTVGHFPSKYAGPFLLLHSSASDRQQRRRRGGSVLAPQWSQGTHPPAYRHIPSAASIGRRWISGSYTPIPCRGNPCDCPGLYGHDRRVR